MSEIVVRAARPQDAGAAARVLRASIRALCAADHGDDPEQIDNWLANKTPEAVAKMIAAGGILVAELSGQIAAVGAVGEIDGDLETGRIVLNYVAPEFRLRGVSRALQQAMEDSLRAAGVRRAVLTSTETARAFYRKAGWREVGPGRRGRWIVGYPMDKLLSRDWGRCVPGCGVQVSIFAEKKPGAA